MIILIALISIFTNSPLAQADDTNHPLSFLLAQSEEASPFSKKTKERHSPPPDKTVVRPQEQQPSGTGSMCLLDLHNPKNHKTSSAATLHAAGLEEQADCQVQ